MTRDDKQIDSLEHATEEALILQAIEILTSQLNLPSKVIKDVVTSIWKDEKITDALRNDLNVSKDDLQTILSLISNIKKNIAGEEEIRQWLNSEDITPQEKAELENQVTNHRKNLHSFSIGEGERSLLRIITNFTTFGSDPVPDAGEKIYNAFHSLIERYNDWIADKALEATGENVITNNQETHECDTTKISAKPSIIETFNNLDTLTSFTSGTTRKTPRKP